MPLLLTEEQSIIRETIGKFAKEELTQIAKDIDTAEAIAPEIYSLLTGLNLYGIFASAEVGGAELDNLSYYLILEEIGYASGTLSLILAAHNSLVLYPLTRAMTQELKPIVNVLAQGTVAGALAHLETDSDLLAAPLKTTARESEGDYYISGEKTMVIAPGNTGYYLVSAQLNQEPALFLVEKSASGLTVGEPIPTIGARGAGIRDIKLDNVKAHFCVAKGNQAQELLTDSVLHYFLALSAINAGIVKNCLSSATGYARERKQFGEKIISFPLVQNHLIKMAETRQVIQLLVHQAALENHLPEWRKKVAYARLYSGQAAVISGISAIQVHGGYGYSKEYPVERYFRDAQMMQSMGGNEELAKQFLAQVLTSGGEL